MGNLQANISKQVFSEFTQFINENSVNIVNKNILKCKSLNNIQFQTGEGKFCDFYCTNCDFNFSQKANSSCQISAENISDIQNSIGSKIGEQLEQFARQGSKNVQDFLATALSFQVNRITTVSQLATLIKNSFQANIQNICEGQTMAANNAVVKLCGSYDSAKFNLSQDAFTTAVASCINQSMIRAFTENSVLREIIQKTDQKLYSEQKGLGSLFTWFAIIGGIILLLLIIGVVIWFTLNRGGSGGQSGGTPITQIFTNR